MKTIMRVGGWIAALLGVLALLVAALWLNGGGTWLVNRWVPGVQVQGLGGNLWHTLQAERVVVRDDEGVWLQAEQVWLEWAPLNLLRGGQVLETLRVAKVVVERQPVYAAGEGESGDGRGNVLAFVPDMLDVRELVVGPHLAGREQRLRVLAARGVEDYRFWGVTLDGPKTQVVGRIDGLDGQQVRGAVRIEEAPQGVIARMVGLPGGGISATLAGVVGADVWQVEQGEIVLGESALRVSGRYVPATEAVVTEVEFRLAQMQDWPVLETYGVKGSVSGTAAVSGTVAQDGQQGDVQLALDVTRERLDFAGRGQVAWTPEMVRATGLELQGPGVEAQGQVSYARASGLLAGALDVEAADVRPLGQLVGLEAQGAVRAEVVLAAEEGIQTGQALLQQVDVRVNGQRLRLREPGRVAWDGARGVVSPLAWDVLGGVVRISGTMDSARIDGGFTAENVDVSAFAGDKIVGNVSGQGRVVGPVTAPVVTWDAVVKAEMQGYPLQANVAGDWRNERVQAEGRVGGEVAGVPQSLQGRLSVQGGLSVWPWRVGIDGQSELAGQVSGDVPLSIFNPLLWPRGMQVGGQVSGTLNVAGTLGEPALGGRVRLLDGNVSHAASGMCLDNVEAEIAGDDTGLRLVSLTARDDRGGVLKGNGTLSLRGERAVNVAVGLEDYRVFCGGLASGQVQGNLALRGDLSRSVLSGNLTVGPLQVHVPGRSGEDIPSVDVVRVGADETGGLGMVMELDVTVEAPQQIFVRGRGLDAEFGGTIRAAGTADDPHLFGQLTALHGTFRLLDRELALADSVVRFVGRVPPSPYLDVKASTEVQGTDVTVNLTGPAAEPKVSLSSTPALPQDEALALLLFGRELSRISAFEALRLAQAARVLAGRDGEGPGVVDNLRDTFGLDTLDIGSGEGGVTVTTGKYVTDDVYVSVSQGAEPEDRQIRTELELTPSINAHTTVDGLGTQRFGVEWTRDY